MTAPRAAGLAGLFLLALFIWVRDLGWTQGVSDTLPVMLALPLFYWLGRPWCWRGTPRPASRGLLALAAALLPAGILLNLTLLLAVAWTALLAAFLRAQTIGFPRRLLILPLLGFPWISQSADAIGWYFRLSGAATAGGLFAALGFHVTREGTFLVIENQPLSVEPACAGLNVLQAMLIAGAALICLQVRPGARFWLSLGLLPLMAWLANTTRIFALGCMALTWGAPFAMGWFHEWGGWSVLCAMFLVSAGAIRLVNLAGGKRTT